MFLKKWAVLTACFGNFQLESLEQRGIRIRVSPQVQGSIASIDDENLWMHSAESVADHVAICTIRGDA